MYLSSNSEVSEFDIMTLDLYFTIQVKDFRNHLLAENIYFTNHRERTDHKNMSLKCANKYQTI